MAEELRIVAFLRLVRLSDYEDKYFTSDYGLGVGVQCSKSSQFKVPIVLNLY